ncbi:MAG: thymidine kinase [Nitrososphaerota archaeon]
MLQIITGSMFSGKTTELLRRLINYSISDYKVICLNHELDNRDDLLSIHNPLYNINNKLKIDFIKSKTIDLEKLEKYDVIGIDEAQFFSELVEKVLYLLEKEKIIIVSGLITDFSKKKFGNIIDLIHHCDTITKLDAICEYCKKPAIFSKRLSENKEQIETGGKDKYIPVCRKHY